MQIRRVAAGYAALMAACAVWFLWHPASHVALATIAAVSAGAVVVGVRLYRPRHAGSWLILAAAVVLDAAARIVYDALPGNGASLKPWIWIVWVLNLGVLVFLAAGALGLARSSLRRMSAAIDAAMIILGSGLIAGILIAIPYADLAVSDAMIAARFGYVVRDVLVLAVAIHVAAAVRWSPSVVLFVTGLLGFVVYDVLFRLGRIQGQRWTGAAIDVPWLVFFAGVGGAALVGSMARFDSALTPRQQDASPLRLALVATLALMPSTVLVVGLFREQPLDQPPIVVAVASILILALARILDAALELRRQAAGERVLREAVIDLASAQQPSAIAPVLQRAVGRLLGSDANYRVAVVLDPGQPMEAWLAGTAGEGLCETETLPIGLASRLRNDQPTMAISPTRPLSPATGNGTQDVDIAEQPARNPAGAVTLLVQGDAATLSALRPRLEVLTAQADVALEQIRLNEENIRHVSESYFRSLIQNSADIILIVDDDNRIKYASPSTRSVFGAVSLPGTSLPELVQQPDRGTVERLLGQVRAAGDNGARSTVAPAVSHGDWVLRADAATPARVEASCRDLRTDPSIGGLVLTLRNVTQQRILEHELEQRALYDPLTGLGNRGSFVEQLDALTSRTDALTAVLYVDVDDLKLVNDALGHEMGDAILAAVADRLETFTAAWGGGQHNMAARLGGDEFAVLLAPVAHPREADAAAVRLLHLLSQPVSIGDHTMTCGASIGVATTDVDAATSRDLVRNADLALYAAKTAGKSQWRHYKPSMRRAVMARLEIRSALERAIADDVLTLEYQPIVGLADGELVGFEALLRWEHPTLGRLCPDRFIDVAEESGLIAPIGEWVLATATCAAQQWGRTTTHASPYVAVNVSARQFRTLEFADTVDRLLARSGLHPERLMLEITETLLLRDDEVVWQNLRHLRRRGVRIAIDDFGTGYSALNYLRHIPLDIIKLDRSFIQSMSTSTQQRKLVEGIVALGETLGLQVTAEGIETEHEREVAAHVGCAYGQGYLFSRPLPAGNVRRWITRPARRPGAHISNDDDAGGAPTVPIGT